MSAETTAAGTAAEAATIRAVIFDLGGVVVDSPLHAIARYEEAQGIPAGFINNVVLETGPAGAWSRLERGEITMAQFHQAFNAECQAAGQQVSAQALMARIAECGPRADMLAALKTLRARGIKRAALTNNWANEEGARDNHALRGHFDVFVESAATGMRKPDPRIYRHTLELLQTPAQHTAMLDDIGRNLKTARQMGMHTIKVANPARALQQLSQLIGFAL